MTRPQIPMEAAFILGRAVQEQPGIAQFLLDAQAAGFGIAQTGDDELPDDEWADLVTRRTRILVAAHRRSLTDGGACPDDPDGLHHTSCGCDDKDPER